VLELSGAEHVLEIAVALLQDRGLLGTEEEEASALRAFFPEDTDVGAIASDLRASLPGVGCREGSPVPVQDWLADWKKSFTGFSLGETLYVLPSWLSRPAIERRILGIDPEQAFGTGTHDTTRLAATLVERVLRKGDRVLDIGTGTGILAMAAAHAGASQVLAIEPDENAAACARENVSRNGLRERIHIETGGHEDHDTLEADLIVANINRATLEAALPRMRARTFVLSGLLADEVDEFLTGLPAGLHVREVWTAGDWSAVVLSSQASRD
jgi:ribosomal protein L11 methyltransferase